LRTSVSRRVEALILSDLLDVPLVEEVDNRGPDALARAVLGALQFREAIRIRGTAAEDEALGNRTATAICEYAGSRSAVAEITTTICVLGVGVLVFQALTPGMISAAPDVADAIAKRSAIATFPLGRTMGGMWYGVLGTNASPWLVTMSVAGLVMIGSIFAAFAGTIADPVQSYLGIHHRRLERLLDTLEAEFGGHSDKHFVAREHFYARLLDLWDAVASTVRIFRN